MRGAIAKPKQVIQALAANGYKTGGAQKAISNVAKNVSRNIRVARGRLVA